MINLVPLDVWKQVFSYLGPFESSKYKCVCKIWNKAIDDLLAVPNAWAKRLSKPYEIDKRAVFEYNQKETPLFWGCKDGTVFVSQGYSSNVLYLYKYSLCSKVTFDPSHPNSKDCVTQLLPLSSDTFVTGHLLGDVQISKIEDKVIPLARIIVPDTYYGNWDYNFCVFNDVMFVEATSDLLDSTSNLYDMSLKIISDQDSNILSIMKPYARYVSNGSILISSITTELKAFKWDQPNHLISIWSKPDVKLNPSGKTTCSKEFEWLSVNNDWVMHVIQFRESLSWVICSESHYYKQVYIYDINSGEQALKIKLPLYFKEFRQQVSKEEKVRFRESTWLSDDYCITYDFKHVMLWSIIQGKKLAQFDMIKICPIEQTVFFSTVTDNHLDLYINNRTKKTICLFRI